MKQEPIVTDMEEPENNTVETWNGSPEKTTATHSVSLNFIAVIILLCTIVIIASGITIANKAVQDIRQTMNDHEYMKVGGEANYKLLREIQKDQMTTYIRELSEKDPAYIESLKRKIKNLEEGKKNLVLSMEEISVLKNNAYIQWSTGATITIVEFSNFACSFCREFHSEWVVQEIVKNDAAHVNYLFKHIPNKNYPDANIFAQAEKCISSHTWGQAYTGFMDMAFNYTGSSGSMLDADTVYELVKKGVESKEEFKTCMSSKEVTESLEQDMGQGIFLGIKSTPSILILNNRTGDYAVIEGKVGKQAIEEQISVLMR